MNRKFKRTLEIEVVCIIINVFTVALNHFNVSYLNQSLSIEKQSYWLQPFEW